MIDDSLASERLIGMIQPAVRGVGLRTPPLALVGCLARITTFQEADDGRYLITLTGVCRFKIVRELRVETPYRQIEADYLPFESDLEPLIGAEINRPRLLEALRRYVSVNGFQADWSAVEEAQAEVLVNALAALCPFEPEEKQALLEAGSLRERVDTLVALLELNSTPRGAGGPEPGSPLQ
ncbi:MAG: LON peptidase substrate-binding domain-containing protein, partial [Hyphomonadaceae bacterium]|nr:LON peptidase substrate-binding domain-containing protein [Hyphomonadaceae bacterium]